MTATVLDPGAGQPTSGAHGCHAALGSNLRSPNADQVGAAAHVSPVGVRLHHLNHRAGHSSLDAHSGPAAPWLTVGLRAMMLPLTSQSAPRPDDIALPQRAMAWTTPNVGALAGVGAPSPPTDSHAPNIAQFGFAARRGWSL